jgi:hypothetical protein
MFYWGRILFTESKIIDFGCEVTNRKQNAKVGHWVIFEDGDYMWLSDWALSKVGYVEKDLVPSEVVDQLDRLFTNLQTPQNMTKELRKKLRNRMDDIGTFIAVL